MTTAVMWFWVSVVLLAILAVLLNRRGSIPETEPSSQPPPGSDFLVRLYGEDYIRVRLLSVHAEFLQVVCTTDPITCPRRATVVLEQVHPQDRARVALEASVHPTAQDRYVFED
jgi:hypothetical protein